ncbi:hypothetical protein GAU_2280 [Gemmatimonas aurantiaca T-27]|uniref:Uncharacterized protein n=1 Tax=Gemmatimonas aurantiaca (strain DSM 14586 / JCM 11422 / NBRC 100505 / T-27) TaxID=379066 RepID=C1AAR6_GEMAT|nr:hypothetical protein GAU_2280 [Gemmatimonas aurantiaca T-27]
MCEESLHQSPILEVYMLLRGIGRTIEFARCVLFAATVAATPLSAQTAVEIAVPSPTGDSKIASLVRVEFDRFKQQTVASLELPPVRASTADGRSFTTLRPSAHFVYKGETPQVPDFVLLMVQSRSAQWEYLRCHDLLFLVDGKPFETPAADHDGRVLRPGVGETVTVMLPPAALIAMANATKVEAKLCRDEFEFDQQARLAFRELASRMKSQ